MRSQGLSVNVFWLLVPLLHFCCQLPPPLQEGVICKLKVNDRLAVLHLAELQTCLAGLSWKTTMCMVGGDAAAAADLVRLRLLHITGDYWGWFGSRSYHHTGMVSLWCASERSSVSARLVADQHSSMREVYLNILGPSDG